MLASVSGVVLKSVKYGETSIIVDVLTQEFGLRTYLMNGVRSKKKSTASLFQLMNQLDMQVYHRLEKDLNRIKEVRLAKTYIYLPFDIRRSAVGQFIAECSHMATNKGGQDEDIYLMTKSYFDLLDEGDAKFVFLHFHFLLDLIANQGLLPELQLERLPYFSISEGRFVSVDAGRHILNRKKTSLLISFFEDANMINTIDRSTRSELLELLLIYLEYHIHGFKEPRSYSILKDVFEG